MSETVGTGVTEQGRDWKITQGVKPENGGYNDHVWQEFAGLAIELGGYSDMTAIDPYSGRRFWLSSAFKCDTHTAMLAAAKPGEEAIEVYRLSHECDDCGDSIYNAIRRLVDAMQAVGFLSSETDEASKASEATSV
jgi:hypothetical protein